MQTSPNYLNIRRSTNDKMSTTKTVMY